LEPVFMEKAAFLFLILKDSLEHRTG